MPTNTPAWEEIPPSTGLQEQKRAGAGVPENSFHFTKRHLGSEKEEVCLRPPGSRTRDGPGWRSLASFVASLPGTVVTAVLCLIVMHSDVVAGAAAAVGVGSPAPPPARGSLGTAFSRWGQCRSRRAESLSPRLPLPKTEEEREQEETEAGIHRALSEGSVLRVNT